MVGPDQVNLEGVGLLEEVAHQVGVECLEGVEGHLVGVGRLEEEGASQA